MPTSSANRVLKVPNEGHPTVKQTLGHAQVATAKERHRALDAPRHQIGVRGLAVREPELAAEMSGRHVGAEGKRLDVQRLRVLLSIGRARGAAARGPRGVAGWGLVFTGTDDVTSDAIAAPPSSQTAQLLPGHSAGARSRPAADGRIDLGAVGDVAAESRAGRVRRGRLRAATAYVATVRQDGVARVHPVTSMIGAGGWYLFMEPTSPKGRAPPRARLFAMHNGVPDGLGERRRVLDRRSGGGRHDQETRPPWPTRQRTRPTTDTLLRVASARARCNGCGDDVLRRRRAGGATVDARRPQCGDRRRPRRGQR